MRVGVDNQQVLICVTDAKIATSTEMVRLQLFYAKHYLHQWVVIRIGVDLLE